MPKKDEYDLEGWTRTDVLFDQTAYVTKKFKRSLSNSFKKKRNSLRRAVSFTENYCTNTVIRKSLPKSND